MTVCTNCYGSGIEPESDSVKSAKVRRIIREVEDEFGYTIEQLSEPSRIKPRVGPRDTLIRRLRSETNLTLLAIAGVVGRADHSTIHASLKRTNGVTA